MPNSGAGTTIIDGSAYLRPEVKGAGLGESVVRQAGELRITSDDRFIGAGDAGNDHGADLEIERFSHTLHNLQGRPITPDRQNCGPHGIAIALALTTSLAREVSGRGVGFVESLRAGRP